MASTVPQKRVSPGTRQAIVPLLSVAEAAERLGTPISFVRLLVAERRIRFCKVGRYVRFSVDDLEEFIAAGWVEARTSPQARDWKRWR